MDHRCSACGARKVMRPVETYIRVPKCPRCKSKKWRVDKYRRDVERRARPCRCVGYYDFPHRKGSGWCVHNQSWSADDARRAFGY